MHLLKTNLQQLFLPNIQTSNLPHWLSQLVRLCFKKQPIFSTALLFSSVLSLQFFSLKTGQFIQDCENHCNIAIYGSCSVGKPNFDTQSANILKKISCVTLLLLLVVVCEKSLTYILTSRKKPTLEFQEKSWKTLNRVLLLDKK